MQMLVKPLRIAEFMVKHLSLHPADGPETNCAVFTMSSSLKAIDAVKLDFYLVILCHFGYCDVAVDHHNYPIGTNMLSIIPPHTVFSIRQFSPDFQAHALVFKSDFVQAGFVKSEIMEELLLINPDYPPVFEIAATTFAACQYKIEKIGIELNTQAAFCLEVSRLYILQLLFDYNRECELCLLNSDKLINRQYQVMYTFRKLVYKNFQQYKTVKEYADLLFLSPKYVSECIKNQTGLSALTLIQQRIVLEAELLLKYTSLPIKSIANQLGYPSTSAFSRFFKSLKGISPVQYQQEQ